MACDVDPEVQQLMGLGTVGDGTQLFKRQFRWTLCIDYCNGTKQVPSDYVKIAARPKLTIEETQIDHLHGRFWIPGKASFDEMNITYYDATSPTAADLFSWIATIYDFTDQDQLSMVSKSNDYEGVGNLFLYDGCGWAIERWTLNKMWPKSIDFGELDMEKSDICMIALTVRYASVEYTSYCGGSVSPCACNACS